MNKSILAGLFFLGSNVIAQSYNSSSIFAHNDYVQPVPFYVAYQHHVGYIEADVFLEENQLYVAHTREEIDKEKSLEALYLQPLQKLISKNSGFAYSDTTRNLVLMVDLKTEGISTLDNLVKKLEKYPELITSPTFKVSVSGNMPDRATWKRFPHYIYFDGRPENNYSKQELARISMISTSFTKYSGWNGKGVLTKDDKAKIVNLIREAHQKGKKIRFWGSPDFNNAWIQFMKLGVDVLNTDNVPELRNFLERLPKNTFTNKSPHEVYQTKDMAWEKTSTPKNIILMIGDGMGLTQLYGGYTANQGSLNIFNLKDIGFSVTTAVDSYITDSAAGGTAMATGSKTNNRFVGVDSSGKSLVAVTDKLKQRGFRTAIITNGDITDATPASFYAHQSERSLSEAIALDLLLSDSDILIGGGKKAFIDRKDGRNLLEEFENKGYSTSESVKSLDSIRSEKFIIIDDVAATSRKSGRGEFLSKSLTKSMRLLAKNDAPFFVMIEGAQIDWGGHNNDMEYVVREVLDFDQAVGEAMKFVDENRETLLLITADHETGGLSLIGGDVATGYVHGSFSTSDHTAVMVPVFSYGPGSELFKGIYQNTDLNWKILELLK